MQELSPRQRIANVDKLIDANHAAVIARVRCRPIGAGGWNTAWQRCPDLWTREHELYSLRGQLQRERDDADHRAAMLKARRESREYAKANKPKRCPTCGLNIYGEFKAAA